MSAWIKTTDSLPPIDKVVLLLMGDTAFPYVGHINDKGRWESPSYYQYFYHAPRVEYWCDIPMLLEEATVAEWTGFRWTALQRQRVSPGRLVSGEFPVWWDDEIAAPRFKMGEKIRFKCSNGGYSAGVISYIRYNLAQRRSYRHVTYTVKTTGHGRDVEDTSNSNITLVQ